MKLKQLQFLSFLVALSGMLYELSFAHFLSALVGGTLLQYSITIGIFTFALGVSTILSQRFVRLSFEAVQSALISTVVLSILLFQWLFQQQQEGIFGLWIYGAYLPVFLVGLLTGLEFPILARALNEKDTVQVFAADYVGMFVATILFPLLLLPKLGLLGSFFVALGFNGLSAILWIWKRRRP